MKGKTNIKREWVVVEVEGPDGAVAYHFTGKDAALRRFNRIIASITEDTQVKAVELWDSRRLLRAKIRVKRQKPPTLSK